MTVVLHCSCRNHQAPFLAVEAFRDLHQAEEASFLAVVAVDPYQAEEASCLAAVDPVLVAKASLDSFLTEEASCLVEGASRTQNLFVEAFLAPYQAGEESFPAEEDPFLAPY